MNVRRKIHSAAFTARELIVVLAILAFLLVWLGAFLPAGSHRASPARIRCTSNLKQIGLAFRGWALDQDNLYPFQVPGLTNLQTGVVISSNTVNAQAWMHFLLLSNELNTARVFMCPGDQARSNHTAENFSAKPSPRGLAHPDSRDAAVSYFVGLAGSPARPQAILLGDRNLATSETNAPFGVGSRTGGSLLTDKAVWSVAPGHQLHGYQGNLLMADGSVQQVSNGRLRGDLMESVQAYGSNANLFLFPR